MFLKSRLKRAVIWLALGTILFVAVQGGLGLQVGGVGVDVDVSTDWGDDSGVEETETGQVSAVEESPTSTSKSPTADSQVSDTDRGSDDEGPSSGVFDDAINQSKLAISIHSEVNDRRRQHGREPLEYRSSLEAVATAHSEDMVGRGYFAHTDPDGETVEDRYENAGVDCRAGGENIAKSYYKTRIEGGKYYDSEGELAKGVVDQWMDSDGHRENILRTQFSQEGIGVAITDEDGNTAVYVTQNFC
jgi:uncharacterized protein YkwD